MKVRLFILGAPGAGKGTISQLLLQALGEEIKYYNVGGILRSQASFDNHIKEVHAAGGLVDSSKVLGIFDEALSHQQFLCDGSPRRPEEASYILSHPLWLDSPGYLIHLNVPLQLAEHRLLHRGRFDDRPEVIKKRFNDYLLSTSQSIELFKSAQRLVTIDASATPEVVCAEILRKFQ